MKADWPSGQCLTTPCEHDGIMNLATLLSLLAFLALFGVVVAVWVEIRKHPDEGSHLESLNHHFDEEIARQRRDIQSDVASQLGPLQQGIAQLAKDVAIGHESSMARQSEQLGNRFEALSLAIQQALRDGRMEQGAQLQQVQDQVQVRLDSIQKGNEAKLEQMRQTVDEKLHATLEQRLGESFKLVSERLEQVQLGLGAMQNLASDVGGLKRALTNVKTRGVLGEAQLGALLEQFLAPSQYATNVKVRPRSNEIVEYAVKLPGPEEGKTVWLPIDAKFPLEDYQRLMEAYEIGDLASVEVSARALENRLLGQARDIRNKYVAPPDTTDFALLFLPFEGLYAEALRRPGLLEKLQRDCKVTIVGPTTLTAFLNSLQVGFKTLAITKQSGEVWRILSAIKTEFGKFGVALEALDKKLDEAKTKLSDVSTRSRLLSGKLTKVEALPEAEVQETLGNVDDEG